MKAGLTARQQHAVKLTIAGLLTADTDAVFAIDRWRDHFRQHARESLSTESVARFNPFEPEDPVWPARQVMCHRGVAALALRGALTIIEGVSRLEDQKFQLQAVIAQRDRAGLDAAAERKYLDELQSALAERRLLRGDVWRRGLVAAGTNAWRELFGFEPVRGKLDKYGVSLLDGSDVAWSFDRLLVDVWAETRAYDKAIQRLSFSGIESIFLKD
ncbi:hypothetical protein MCEMSEM23_02307 [Rhabdaerophilaceae bacterium]